MSPRVTAVDQPDNGQDEQPWRVGSHYGIHVYKGGDPVATFLRPENTRRPSIATGAFTSPMSCWPCSAVRSRTGRPASTAWTPTAGAGPCRPTTGHGTTSERDRHPRTPGNSRNRDLRTGRSGMTPEQRALRDAFLSEMWATVPEYRSSRTHNDPATGAGSKAGRCDALPNERTSSKTTRRAQDRLVCPFCQVSYDRASLPRHLSQAHSADYEEIA